MDRFDVMRLFVRVTETGSFSKAAAAWGVGQPAVSKQIAALEQRLGAQLVRRTSRGLNLTTAGAELHEFAVRLLGEVEAAELRIGKGEVSPAGLLRVAISAGFGRMYVVPQLPRFLARYPDLDVEFLISERHVNLIEDGIDLAVRIGVLSDSSLLARRVGSMRTATVASPDYFARKGVPATPGELEQHDAVVFVFQGAPRPWQFNGPSGPITLTPRGRVRANDAEHIRAAILSGLGVCHNASWLFDQDIASGAVQQVLKDFAPTPSPIHAVYPAGRLVASKVKVFADFLVEVCNEAPSLHMD